MNRRYTRGSYWESLGTRARLGRRAGSSATLYPRRPDSERAGVIQAEALRTARGRPSRRATREWLLLDGE
eukprot:scaffold74170_cov63-Phaeocystis_antarctica.AAC.2